MATSTLSFNFGSNAVRAFSDEQNQPWLAAADVCEVLEFKNARDAVTRHCREWGVVKRDTPTDSGIQAITYINEGNVYRLITKSRKAVAQEFERNLFEVILPSIRKTGTYSVPYAVANSDTLSAAQQTELRTLIQGAAERLPHSARASFTIAAWSKLKAHFKTDYRHIPTAQYGDALNLLARHIAQALAAPQPALPLEHCPECANCARLSSPVYSLPNIWAHLTSPGSYLFDKQTLSAIATDCINKLAGKPFPDYLGFNNHTHYEGQVRTDLSGRNS